MGLPSSAIQAIVTGGHRDPFSVLGPHAEEPDGITVRAFLPGVRDVTVVPGDGARPEHSLHRLHPAGLWEGTLPGGALSGYRLRVTDENGRVREIEDVYHFPPTLSEYDLHLLGEGTHYRIFDKLGAHQTRLDGVDGVLFAVWAPNARRVSVVGDWNAWDGRRQPMRLHPGNGIWELFVPGVAAGAPYKFEILDARGKLLALKADPLAFAFEPDLPRTASVVTDLDAHEWRDAAWIEARARRDPRTAPLSIYEVHLGSWRRRTGDEGGFLDYRELGEQLADYAVDMGFTHVELLT